MNWIIENLIETEEEFQMRRSDIRLEDCVPEDCWYELMDRDSRENLVVMVLVYPLIACLVVGCVTGIMLNIPLTYLIMDTFIVLCRRHFAIIDVRKRKERAARGDEIEYLLRLLGQKEELEDKQDQE